MAGDYLKHTYDWASLIVILLFINHCSSPVCSGVVHFLTLNMLLHSHHSLLLLLFDFCFTLLNVLEFRFDRTACFFLLIFDRTYVFLCTLPLTTCLIKQITCWNTFRQININVCIPLLLFTSFPVML